jgi:hypothetical protein
VGNEIIKQKSKDWELKKAPGVLRGLRGAQTEISLAVAAYNLKGMRNILAGRKLTTALLTA